MFSHDQPHQEMECLFRFKEIKTKKWTERGFNSAFKMLLRPVDPTIKMKAKVKLEPMHLRPDGYPKAPEAADRRRRSRAYNGITHDGFIPTVAFRQVPEGERSAWSRLEEAAP